MTFLNLSKSRALYRQLACLCLCAVFFSSASNADDFAAFDYISPKDAAVTDASNAKLLESDSLESWAIAINPQLKLIEQGQFFELFTPQGKRLSVRVESREVFPNGDVQIVGGFDKAGSVVFTLGKQSYYASINREDISFAISGAEVEGIIINNASIPTSDVQLGDDMRWPEDHDIEKKTLPAPKELNRSEPNSKDGGTSKIGVLVVYSKEFEQLFSNPETRINQLIGFSNSVFDRSGILIELDLVRAKLVNFDNSANLGTSLSQATDGIGAFSGLHRLRDVVGGDLVVVLHGGSGFSASGVAWVNGERARFGYSATRISERCCDSVFTHELGHNLGSGHERLSVNPSQPSPCRDVFTDYACGYGNSANDWGTIMSALSSRVVGHRFSNPDQLCLGEPCGVPIGSPNAADNRTAFNLSRINVAAFEEPDQLSWLPAIGNLLGDD